MTSRRPALVLVALTVLAALPGCREERDSWPDKGLRVVVTGPPLASITDNVIGDHGAVHCLCTGAGNGICDYYPTPEDAGELHEADLLFINGLGLDQECTERLLVNSGNAKLKQTAVGEQIPPGDRIVVDNKTDPRVWLGIPQTIDMVGVIRDRLKEADTRYAADFDARAEQYAKQLTELLNTSKEDLVGWPKADRKIVSLHDSLAYFARQLDVNVVGVVEVPPDEEPTPHRLERIAELCRKNNVRLIAVPKAYPGAIKKKFVEQLKKKDAGDVDFVVIDPLEESDGPVGADWYATKMKQNFAALKAAAVR